VPGQFYALGEAAELVGQSGAPDVVVKLGAQVVDLGRDTYACGSCESGIAGNGDVEVFAADRPSMAKRIFRAHADRPAGAAVGLKLVAEEGPADRRAGRGTETLHAEMRAVDLHPGSAAGDVEKVFVERIADPATRRGEPALLRLISGGIEQPRRGRKRVRQAGPGSVERLAFLVEVRPVAFDPDDPRAELVVTADIPAAGKPGQVEVVRAALPGKWNRSVRTRGGNGGGARRGIAVAVSRPIADQAAHMTTGPAESCWSGGEGPNPHIGCDRRSACADRHEGDGAQYELLHFRPPKL
jgi:hypothetical protein